MGKICDRSPCNNLLASLGNFIFGSVEGGFYLTTGTTDDHASEVEIDYCPFCGTRLEEVPPVIVQRFTKPRKRRRVLNRPLS